MLRPISEHAREAHLRLIRAGIKADEARLDAELLARHVLGWDRARYIAYQRQPLAERSAAAYDALVARRERREPLAYLVGTREFYGRDFEVGRDVLIPRPETELLVETVLHLVAAQPPRHDQHSPLRLADVGTGSGCVAVTLAAELPPAHVTAIDVSAAALAVARRNATRHGVGDRVHFVEWDLLDGLVAHDLDGTPHEAPTAFDIVVSNPPYVPSPDAARLAPEVATFEPSIALYGGPDGLEVVRVLVAEAQRALRPGGWLAFEIGAGQAGAVAELLPPCGLRLERIARDLQGIPRVVLAQRDSESAS